MEQSPDPVPEPSPEQGMESGTEPGMESRSGWLDAFAIDPRSLAAVRIGVGLVTLYDLAVRSTKLVYFYTDAGIAPRDLYLDRASGWQTVYALTGSAAGVAALFVLHAIFAILLVIGYRTRLMTAACLVMTWSLINRNLPIMNGGDQLLAWLLAWSLFLPTGLTASVDAITSGSDAEAGASRRPITSAATAGLLLQIAIIYLFALAARTNADWWIDFSAVHYLVNSVLATPIGHQLAHWPAITMLMTAGTVFLELAGPFVALLSWRNPRLRTLVVIAFIGLHVGMALTMYLGTFALVCIVAWLAYVPAETWNAIFAAAPARTMSRAWGALLAKLADGIERMHPKLAAHTPPRPLGRIGNAVAAALLAYIVLVNVIGALPARFVGPLARLPQFKQNWKLIDQPPHYDQHVIMTATLADGTTRLIASGSEYHSGWREYLWPTSDVRDRKYWRDLWGRPIGGLTAGDVRYFDRHRTLWNETHPAEQQITEFRCVWEAFEIPPVELADRPRSNLNVQRHLVYSWPADEAALGK